MLFSAGGIRPHAEIVLVVKTDLASRQTLSQMKEAAEQSTRLG